MIFEYKTMGVCSRKIILEMDGDIIRRARFEGGCNGNLKGVCALIQNRCAQDIIALLEGTPCGDKSTSCPDQLSRALRSYLESGTAAGSELAGGTPPAAPEPV